MKSEALPATESRLFHVSTSVTGGGTKGRGLRSR